MAEALKRWTGTEWVTVAVVNRIEVGGGTASADFVEFFFIDGIQIIGIPTSL
jgi:hypothetical protein